MIKLEPGMIVITQGDPNSIISHSIRWASKSWWTHTFLVLNEHEGLEAVVPKVRKLNISERFAELESQNRDYVILDLLDITTCQRLDVVNAALQLENRWYDVCGCLYYVIFKRWFETQSIMCSRLMTVPFYDAIGLRIFEWCHLKLPQYEQHRRKNLIRGYCSPDELFRYSDLEVVYRSK